MFHKYAKGKPSLTEEEIKKVTEKGICWWLKVRDTLIQTYVMIRFLTEKVREVGIASYEILP